MAETEIELALREHYKATSAITALVGHRVYCDVAPQRATYPRITIQLISSQRVTSQARVNAGDINVQSRVQVDLWVKSRDASRAKRDLLALRRQVNYATEDAHRDESMQGVTVKRAFLDDETSQSDKFPDGSDEWVFRRTQDYLIWHTEATS